MKQNSLPVTWINNDSARSFNAGDHNFLSAVQVDGVNTVVSRIRPVNLLLSPVVCNAFWVDTLRDDVVDGVVAIASGSGVGDTGVGPNLRKDYDIIGEIEVHADNISQIHLENKETRYNASPKTGIKKILRFILKTTKCATDYTVTQNLPLD